MKNPAGISVLSFIVLFVTLFSACKDEQVDHTIGAFNNGGNERNMIVVMSDLHLGADLTYAECNKNLGSLEKLLKQIKASPNVKELVIAGDMLDEWFVPANVDTYQGKDQADFVKRIAATNKGVIDALNSIIGEKKIRVTYVPGNHDLTITAANVESILPGINQARDKEQGLGTYLPVDCSKIAIEHGHRYNFFCAPDPISNQDIAPGTILPPGYFYTRIAVLYVMQKPVTPADTPPVITKDPSATASQSLLYTYWYVWSKALASYPIANKFDEKIIVTNVNGFKGNYAVNDILPYQTTPGGAIDVKLYKGIQDSWIQRQALNHVAIPIPVGQAIAGSGKASEAELQAQNQYFLNPASDKRIVIFGHTHDPKIIASTNLTGQKCIYANSGTWIDHNGVAPTTMSFVVITPQNANASSQTYVKLYNFQNEVITPMAQDSIRY
ncbi:metallophosphoesterase [Paludibacter propionicigenes WB4]|uniref:Metallophosphoesterase n=1 Tax=Paludibacter propionicigenes (strain DSM 17365 / JCM 13257 / WB4) TaxID=694427 RepID=E4T6U7_PALPW|nr:metallophosphoesterase [Paludibacter propionicigenes]ADQ80441.1 metallophosphoesterase [Paludibacter propionicigenes WB4]